MTADLVSWLRDALDDDERVALAASQGRDGSTPGGEHWHWECGTCDTPIPITAVTLLDEFLACPRCGTVGVALRSVEEYLTESVGALSHFVVYGTEEQRPVDALHLARHSPSRVLRQVAAHRAVLKLYGNACSAVDQWSRITMQLTKAEDRAAVDVLGEAVRSIAAIYQDRPGWDPSWTVEG